MKDRKQKTILIITSIMFVLILLISIFPVTSLIIEPPTTPRDFSTEGVYYHNSLGNAYFTTNRTLNFSQIILNDSYVQFNDTAFYVASPNRTNISIDYINESASASNLDDFLLGFYANTTAGTVYFNISGFDSTKKYSITRDGTLISTTDADDGGFVNFTNAVWSEKQFNMSDAGAKGGGTDYFVKNGGDDAKSGLDDANAWETMGKVNTEMPLASGDNVYFKYGDSWTDASSLTITGFYGTTGDRAILGAYGTPSDGLPIIHNNTIGIYTSNNHNL
ncbi:unnamed protein product, partial [marine sediment metagenome]